MYSANKSLLKLFAKRLCTKIFSALTPSLPLAAINPLLPLIAIGINSGGIMYSVINTGYSLLSAHE